MNKYLRILSIYICLSVVCVLPEYTMGQTFSSTVSQFDSRLREALNELSAVRESIASEKVPLYRQVNELEEDVISKRKDLKAAERDRDNKLVDLNALKSEVKTRNTEKDFLTSLLNEYIDQFSTRLHITEYEELKNSIDEIKAASDKPDASLTSRLEAMASTIELSMDRLDGVKGGRIFQSQALSDSGKLVDGKVVLVGPLALFAADEGDQAGLAELRLGSPKPKIVDMGTVANAAVKPLAASGSGSMPIDATMGNALKLAATQETWFEHIKKGGIVIIPMLVLALVSLIIALVKYIQFSRIRRARAADVKAILDYIDQDQDQAARDHARKIGGPFGRMLTRAIDHARDRKELIEEVVYEVMLETKPALERALPFISLTAATSPLLGLLGTVTGMIKTFKMITVFGTGDPKTLSSGISEALVTTEYGLIIAVPTLILFALLSRSAKSILGQMELASVAFVNGAPGDGSESQEEVAA